MINLEEAEVKDILKLLELLEDIYNIPEKNLLKKIYN